MKIINMKMSIKLAVVNKYNLIAFFSVFCGSFLSWAISQQFFQALFMWNKGRAKEEYLDIIYSFYTYAIFGFSLMQVIIPFLASLITIPFYNEKNIFSYSYVRLKKYSKAILLPALRQIFIGCLFLYLGYICFLILGLVWRIDPSEVYVTLPSGEIAINRQFMPELFGEDFAARDMFLFFVVDGIWKYIVFCFVYGLSSICVSFYTSKKYMSLLIPSIYYIVLDIICSGINRIELGNKMVFELYLYSPSYAIMSGGYQWRSIMQIVYPLLPPLIFCLFTLLKEFYKNRGRSDVYAV